MITREAADEEQRTLERDIARLREALAEKEQALKEKDGQITELRQIGNVVFQTLAMGLLTPYLRERASV